MEAEAVKGKWVEFCYCSMFGSFNTFLWPAYLVAFGKWHEKNDVFLTFSFRNPFRKPFHKSFRKSFRTVTPQCHPAMSSRNPFRTPCHTPFRKSFRNPFRKPRHVPFRNVIPQVIPQPIPQTMLHAIPQTMPRAILQTMPHAILQTMPRTNFASHAFPQCHSAFCIRRRGGVGFADKLYIFYQYSTVIC